MTGQDGDLVKLYSEKILALAADIPHRQPLPEPQARVMRRSPICGSTVTVDLVLRDGRIAAFGQDVRACALGQASAAIFGRQAIGLTRADVARCRDQLRAMLKEGGPPPDPPFADYGLLAPARDYKNRHASILLVLDATLAAFDEIAARDG
ncbi:MAG: iron-sulfur cluster scaffold-like protein [Paracoccaceae bacterium]|nr:MAG: iron-sulfur cluster assembly scaffold protein [Alphaproteobacteria bacterium]GIX13541.1 MAG: iron-sulfur cluster scaffold-like protein [Paracoccaceae bacterium]